MKIQHLKVANLLNIYPLRLQSLNPTRQNNLPEQSKVTQQRLLKKQLWLHIL